MVLPVSSIISPAHRDDQLVGKALRYITDYDGATYRDPLIYFIDESLGPSVEAYIKQALTKLDEILAIDFRLTDKREEAVIYIYLHTFTGEGKAGQKGLTSTKAGMKKTLKDTADKFEEEFTIDIEIAIEPSLGSVELGDYPGLTEITAYTILHELGHSLGLRHPDDNPWDSRYSTLDTVQSYNYRPTDLRDPFFTSLDVEAFIDLWGAASAETTADKSMTDSDWEAYVDRYRMTLGIVYEGRVGKTGMSKADFGRSHYSEYGLREGRSLVEGRDSDLSDYGAYVENYGSTLLDVYRSNRLSIEELKDATLFEWGKWHYRNYGKREGRNLSGGIDWGAIVREIPRLHREYEADKKDEGEITAFEWGARHSRRLNDLDETSIGSEDADILTGKYTHGGAGDDIITGTKGDDVLSGGNGDDIISGGEGGFDRVYGGAGRDVFIIDKNTTLDIRDYRGGVDALATGKGIKRSELIISEVLLASGVVANIRLADSEDLLGAIYGARISELEFVDGIISIL